MNLNCGLIGLPMVGKTTIFNLLTGAGAETSKFLTGKTETNIGTARIPDGRVDYLSDLYHPRKTTHAQIQFSDVPGLVRGSSQGKGVGNQFLNAIRNVDMLAHVVRSFSNPEVPHVDDAINPLRDLETVNMELLFADMEIIEKRSSGSRPAKRLKKKILLNLRFLANASRPWKAKCLSTGLI